MKLRITSLTLASALLMTTASYAQPPDRTRRAADLFAEGKTAFAHGDYAIAAARFEAASAVAPHPATLLNASEAWELAGEHARAADACDRVLADGAADAKFLLVARSRLARVLPRTATIELEGEPSLRARIDAAPDGALRRVRLAPGRHTVVFVEPASGRVDEHVVEIPAGETAHLAASFPAPPAPMPEKREPVAIAPAAEPPSSSGPPLQSMLAFGGAVVTAGVGAYFAVDTMNARADFDRTPTTATADHFDRSKTFTNVAFAWTGALVATGVVLWLVLPNRKASPNIRGMAPALRGEF
jgi:hypothetical protein